MKTKYTSKMAPESQNFMDQFPRDIQPKSYGNWALGFDWVYLVGGRSGLAIYARHYVKEPVKAIVVRMKNAMAFAEKNRIPARAFGKFMAEAMSGEWDFDEQKVCDFCGEYAIIQGGQCTECGHMIGKEIA
jgi:hypothetical protein